MRKYHAGENLSREGFSSRFVVTPVCSSPAWALLRVRRSASPGSTTRPRAQHRARTACTTQRNTNTQKKKEKKRKPLGDVSRPAHHPWYRENEDKDNTTARLLRAPHKDHSPTSLPAGSPSHGGGSGRGHDYAELKSQALRVASAALEYYCFLGAGQVFFFFFFFEFFLSTQQRSKGSRACCSSGSSLIPRAPEAGVQPPCLGREATMATCKPKPHPGREATVVT